MSCHVDGRPSMAQRAARFKYTDESTTSADPIAIDEIAKTELMVEQISVHWSAAPTTSENITLHRDSIDGAAFDNLYRSEDPSINSWTDWTCVTGFRFSKGDKIQVDFPNTDDLTVGVTIWLVQVDN